MGRLLAVVLLAGSVAGCRDRVQVRLSDRVHYDHFVGTAVDSSKWVGRASMPEPEGAADRSLAVS